MSISYRSLGILIVAILCLIGWLTVVSASGPRTASADALAPFPPERSAPVAEMPTPPAPGDVSDPVESSRAGFAGETDPLVSILKSRLSGFLRGDDAAISESNRDILVFVPERPQWRADANGDGELNEADIAEFSELWSWADPLADFNADGIVDPDDYAAFVDSFNASEAKPLERQRQLIRSGEFVTTIRFESGGVQMQFTGEVEVTPPPKD